jgi:site-specific recombinase XerD
MHDPLSESTARLYRADFRRFEDWCATRSCACVPASLDAVVGFVRAELAAGFARATIARRLAAIAAAHAREGATTPTRDARVRTLLRRPAYG